MKPLVAGDLLVSPPNLPDPRFDRTVIVLTYNNSRGSFGLCMNRRSEHTVNEILKPLDIVLDQDQPMYWGGPVNPTTVWMLHDSDWSIDNTVPIDEHWSLTSSTSMFDKISSAGYPKRFRIFFGHSSWGPGQLIRELQGEEPWHHEHSWLTVKDPDPLWLIDCDPGNLWTTSCSICSQQAVEGWMN